MEKDIFKLYHVNGDIEILLDQFIEAETDEAGEQKLIELTAQLNSSVEKRREVIASVCASIKNYECIADTLAWEESALAARKKLAHDRAEKLKEQLAKLIPHEKWTNGVHSIGWRLSKSVKVNDQSQIPVEFLRHIPESWEPKKTDIKNAIEGGASVPGCEVESKNNIQIK